MGVNEEGRTAALSRREMLAGCGAAAVAAVGAAPGASRAGVANEAGALVIGLNTSTIRGQKLSIVEIIGIAAKAGYRGMEPWIDELNRYRDEGGSLSDLRKRFEDAGVAVESAIDFFEWAVDDPSRRAKGMEAARRTMDLLQKIGGKRIAAPPSGATEAPPVALPELVDRYRALLELGDGFGVVPEVEVWGPSQSLGNLAEAAYVAVASGHPKACILPDVYHMHRGGSPFEGLKLLSPAAVPVFHFNDYPAAADRTTLTDADRVYPGDGVAPLKAILKTLVDGGFRVMLSLEVFNRAYWKQDPAVVAKTGYDKIKRLVDAATASS